MIKLNNFQIPFNKIKISFNHITLNSIGLKNKFNYLGYSIIESNSVIWRNLISKMIGKKFLNILQIVPRSNVLIDGKVY